MKRPAFQFYPGDWLRSTDLRTCSIPARGLWIDMLCLMHEGYPYGYLRVGDKDILPPILARIVGADVKDVEGWLEELRVAGVYSITPEGTIYSRRMERDESNRLKRAAGGHLSLKNENVPRPKDIHEGHPQRISSQPSSGGSLGVSPAFAFAVASAVPVQNHTSSLRSDVSTPVLELPPKDQKPTPVNNSTTRASRFTIEKLPSAWAVFCKQERPDLDPNRVFEKFKDYWQSEPGRDGLKLNWLATWRNWVRTEKRTNGPATDDWWRSEQGIIRKGAQFNIKPNPGETMVNFKDRVHEAMGAGA